MVTGGDWEARRGGLPPPSGALQTRGQFSVYVLPEPVWPYANKQTLKPSNADWTTWQHSPQRPCGPKTARLVISVCLYLYT